MKAMKITLSLIIIWNDDMNPVKTAVVKQELQCTEFGKRAILTPEITQKVII